MRNVSRTSLGFLVVLSTIALASPAPGQVVVPSVPGSSNPYLAGMPNGTTCCSGDSAPAQSPVLFTGALTPGSTLTFTVTGSVSHLGGVATLPPDGDAGGVASSPRTMGLRRTAGRSTLSSGSSSTPVSRPPPPHRRGWTSRVPASAPRFRRCRRRSSRCSLSATAGPATDRDRCRRSSFRPARPDFSGNLRRIRLVQQQRVVRRHGERRRDRSDSDPHRPGSHPDSHGDGDRHLGRAGGERADAVVPDARAPRTRSRDCGGVPDAAAVDRRTLSSASFAAESARLGRLFRRRERERCIALRASPGAKLLVRRGPESPEKTEVFRGAERWPRHQAPVGGDVLGSRRKIPHEIEQLTPFLRGHRTAPPSPPPRSMPESPHDRPSAAP